MPEYASGSTLASVTLGEVVETGGIPLLTWSERRWVSEIRTQRRLPIRQPARRPAKPRPFNAGWTGRTTGALHPRVALIHTQCKGAASSARDTEPTCPAIMLYAQSARRRGETGCPLASRAGSRAPLPTLTMARRRASADPPWRRHPSPPPIPAVAATHNQVDLWGAAVRRARVLWALVRRLPNRKTAGPLRRVLLW